MELSPSLAVRLAEASYLARAEPKIQSILNQVSLADQFAVDQSTIVSGSSGAIVRQSSAFALVLAGRGAWQGQYVVAVRGTVTLADVLSDLAAALDRGPGGYFVHAGFNRVATSIIPGVLAALRNKNPSRVHCVGHSLGGAVAHLMAAQLDKQVGGGMLYTFGSPRVGPDAFAENLTWSLGESAIHRAFNLCDAVPMVPIFPFSHAPFRSDGALVGDARGLISVNAHLLRTYGPAVADQTWKGLKLRARATPMGLDQLLDQTAAAVRFPGGALALHLLGRVLAQLLAAADAIIGTVVTAHMTLLDRMAWMLINCARASAAMAAKVERFLAYVMQFLGRPAINGISLTSQFIQSILGLLRAKIMGLASSALKKEN